jgi:hypothetical protein
VRSAWRTKAKRLYVTKPPAEKARLKEKRLSHKKDYNEALQEAQQIVHQQATLLHERFGGHSIQWYFQEILQQSQRQKSQCQVTAWNAYLSSEVKRINNGIFFSFLFSLQNWLISYH